MPAGLSSALRHLAETEQRSMSGVIQEAVRLYVATRQFETLQRELSLKAKKMGIASEEDVDDLIHGLRHRR